MLCFSIDLCSSFNNTSVYIFADSILVMCGARDNEWFRGWFNSPYYHILYKHRDDAEAANFLDALMTELNLQSGSEVLDLACGKGRHSIYLHQKGYQVTGLDLSEESIKLANEHSTEGLEFYTGDMRSFQLEKKYSAILNLFTSFGYFDEKSDNLKVIQCIHQHLDEDGLFVMDYFNPSTICCKKHSGDLQIDGIQFNITKKLEGEHVIKEIEVLDQGFSEKFMEKVQLFTLPEILNMLESSGFRFLTAKGNYAMDDFHENSSERMIIIAQKS